MSKQEVRLFFTSLLLTLLFFAFIGAFLLVDDNASRRERGSNEQIFFLAQSGEDVWEMTLFGRKVNLSVAPLRQLSELHASYAPILLPRSAYAVTALWDYSVYWGEKLYDRYNEYIYLQEVGINQEKIEIEQPEQQESDG